MNGFTRIATALAALVVAGVAVGDPAGRFIPQSPLDESERAAERARLKKMPAFPDRLIDEMLADEERYHTYREADIFAAYPELRGEKKLWLCSNNIIGGATEIAFLAARGKNNDVTLDTLGCSRVKNGLSCGEPKRASFYHLDASEQYFSLEGLSFETARAILETYRAKLVTGLPEWMNTRNMKISSIKSLSGNRYEMMFGDTLCSGCASKFDVRLETKNGANELVFDGDPRAVCF